MGEIYRQVYEAPSQRDALLAIARGIDDVREQLAKQPTGDEWSTWMAPAEDAPSEDGEEPYKPEPSDSQRIKRLGVTKTGDLEIEVPIVDEGTMARRRSLAIEMGLQKELGQYGDMIEAYAKGGPEWLYFSNRDFVMQRTREIRRAMVSDINKRDPALAHKVSMDILKYNAEDADRGIPKDEEMAHGGR